MGRESRVEKTSAVLKSISDDDSPRLSRAGGAHNANAAHRMFDDFDY